MAEEGLRPIIVKRVKKGGHGHHGGAWKIAYADFVTAMMAFFLLMWLIGSTTKGDLSGIAEFFKNPLKVAMSGGDGSGNSDSVLTGGGTDPTRNAGQVQKTNVDANKKKSLDLKAAKEMERKKEVEKLKALKTKIEQAIDATPQLAKYKKQLLVDITLEGLRIQIIDEKNRPMFASGKAEPEPYMREILIAIGSLLNNVENKIGLSGHTDANPYLRDDGYSNWELSADRANASRRALVQGGMRDDKVLRVNGLGSAAAVNKADPFDPLNRRITILVMNKQTEDDILRNATLKVGEEEANAEQAPKPEQ